MASLLQLLLYVSVRVYLLTVAVCYVMQPFEAGPARFAEADAEADAAATAAASANLPRRTVACTLL